MSEQNAIKIIVDTNIWISFIIGRSLDSLIDLIKSKKVEVYFSQELHDELFTVLTRPKLISQISEDKVAEIREVFKDKAAFIKPDCIISDCRDPKDNFLLELAVSVNADYLITGDNDLLSLDPYRKVRIVKANEFEKIISTRSAV